MGIIQTDSDRLMQVHRVRSCGFNNIGDFDQQPGSVPHFFGVASGAVIK